MIILDLLSPGSQDKRLWYQLNRRMGGPQDRRGRFEEDTDPFPLPGIEGRYFGYAVRVKISDLLISLCISGKKAS